MGSTSIKNTLSRARYRALRDLDVPPDDAAVGCRSAASFIRAVQALGRDPSEWPKLSARQQGGHPGPPRRPQRAARYRVLRDLGATAEFANQFSTSEGALEIGKRKLRLGIGKPPQ
jgi:hypothetical protein